MPAISVVTYDLAGVDAVAVTNYTDVYRTDKVKFKKQQKQPWKQQH